MKGILFKDIFDCPSDNLKYQTLVQSEGQYQVIIEGCGLLVFDSSMQVNDIFQMKNKNYRRIFKDREGNIWVSTSDNGIYFLTAQARNSENYVFEDDIRILTLTGDGKGQLFWGTDKGGIYHFQNGNTKRLIEASKLGNHVNGLQLDSKGNLFFGAEKNGFKVDVNHLSDENRIKKIKDMGIVHSDLVLSDLRGNSTELVYNVKDFAWDEELEKLWWSSGYFVFHIDFKTQPKPLNDLVQLDKIMALAIGKKGKTWAGGPSGLWLIDNGSIIDKMNLHKEFKYTVQDIAVDKNDVVWVGTEGHGVYGFRNDSIFLMPATKGDFILSVYVDEENYLWIGTDFGAKQLYIDKKNPNQQKIINNFTINDGLASDEVNAIFVDSQFIYFGTNNGLSKIDKSFYYKNEMPPAIYIKNIKVNGIEFPIKENYELGYQQNELEIEYVALSYKSFGKVNYQYQLENADEHWQSTQNRNVRYTKLQPGDYHFLLKATDISGVENKIAAPIHFTIRPPFWQTWWFRILGVLFIAGIIYLWYRRRVRLTQEKEAEKTATNKKFAELEMQALQSQMNPHFVFNALASIQSFIQDNEVEVAEEYLASFGELMRMFLDSSKSKFTTLEDELRLIRLYIEMEQMRFVNRFETNIAIDEKIDPSISRIPTLLLQPFVENAINHGLFHKEGKGHLDIGIHLEGENTLICTIEDDGIGRAAVAQLQSGSVRAHKSRATQIVNERLEVFKKTEGIDITVDIEDKYDDERRGTGTVVRIRMPVME